MLKIDVFPEPEHIWLNICIPVLPTKAIFSFLKMLSERFFNANLFLETSSLCSYVKQMFYRHMTSSSSGFLSITKIFLLMHYSNVAMSIHSIVYHEKLFNFIFYIIFFLDVLLRIIEVLSNSFHTDHSLLTIRKESNAFIESKRSQNGVG